MLLNLTGKKILVTGIANNRSIAWGIAQQLSKAGAELGITYLPDEKGRFESKVRELTEPLNPSLFLPLDVQNPSQIEEIFKNIKDKNITIYFQKNKIYLFDNNKNRLNSS